MSTTGINIVRYGVSHVIYLPLGSIETGRKATVDTRHTLTQSGDWSGATNGYLPPEHRALWSESPSEEDWHFRHFPV